MKMVTFSQRAAHSPSKSLDPFPAPTFLHTPQTLRNNHIMSGHLWASEFAIESNCMNDEKCALTHHHHICEIRMKERMRNILENTWWCYIYTLELCETVKMARAVRKEQKKKIKEKKKPTKNVRNETQAPTIIIATVERIANWIAVLGISQSSPLAAQLHLTERRIYSDVVWPVMANAPPTLPNGLRELHCDLR